MRNLVILSHHVITSLEALDASTKIEALANNLEDGTIYVAASCKSSTASDDVKILFMKNDEGVQHLSPFTSLIVPTALPPRPYSSFAVLDLPTQAHEIVSFHYLSDGGKEALNEPALCTVTAGGDILLLPLQTDPDCPPTSPQIVGSIEQGIAAACWSPDNELLVVITNETPSDVSASCSREGEKVLLMTKDFDVLAEKQLRTDDFGEDPAVDVGWGSKATQFHGSEGKAAAAAAAATAAAAQESKVDTRGPHVPDDDCKPRVSWRGDGAFFAISSLEPYQPKFTEEQEERTWHRVIRIYARLGALSATSDASVRGLSQALAFRPAGNLIATTQRFGPSGNGQMWAQGRQGRHDVAFFERNGLRHGEFSLREESASQPDGEQIAWSVTQTEKAWLRDHKVRELIWNSDGTALAVWLSRASQGSRRDVNVVQVYTTGNYHWYLKQEFVSAISTGELQQVKWHAEDPLQCALIYGNRIEHVGFFMETVSSGGKPPHDVACISVADGTASLLTPFRLQNVPPPMSSSSLLHPPATLDAISSNDTVSVPVHSSWSQLPPGPLNEAHGIMALLFPNGVAQIWLFDWGALSGKRNLGGSAVAKPRLVQTIKLRQEHQESTFFQIAVAGWASTAMHNSENARISLAVLASSGLGHTVTIVEMLPEEGLEKFAASPREPLKINPSKSLRLAAHPFVSTATTGSRFYVETDSGLVHLIGNKSLEPILELERFCPELRILARPDGQMVRVIGLASNGRLYANQQIVAKDATSFTLAGSFLVWTNTSHQAQFISLNSLSFSASTMNTVATEFIDLGRRVERGSRIVTAVTSLMAIVLQMPRGNLETIFPRPLVLEVVRRDLDNKRYGAAFRICRTHRMDVNILYDHNPDLFMINVDTFVRQVQDVDHINLFLSGLKNEDVTTTLYKPALAQPPVSSLQMSEKVNRICDAMRVELDKADPQKYINSILTTHVRKVPADYEAGLALLLRLKEKNQQLAEEAVKYIIFLADADKLYDVALGMYDFALTLMIAQHAQRKDPREYLPFLRELRALSPPEFQKHKIDDYLKRYNTALAWLFKAGPAHHEEALRYIQKHKLFHEALELYRVDATSSTSASSRLREVYGLFGSYLVTRRKYEDAGIMFQLAHQKRNAIEAYKESVNWREVLRLGIAEKLPASEVMALAKELVDELEATKKFTDASRIALDYLKDVEQGVAHLCRDHRFSEAERVLQTHSRLDLVPTTFNPLLTEAVAWLLEETSEISEQLEKQLARIVELRTKKETYSNDNVDGDDPALDNIDIMSDTSTQMTQFTRYTTTASIATQSSLATFSTKSGSRKKEAKLKKKQERKKAGGKKGSVYEEDYLYTSITKLLNERLSALQEETCKVLPHLVVSASTALRSKAKDVHTAVDCLEKKAEDAVADLWSYSQEDDDQRFKALVQFDADILSGALASNPTLAAITFRTCVNRPVPRPKITVAEKKWRVVLLDQASSPDQ